MNSSFLVECYREFRIFWWSVTGKSYFLVECYRQKPFFRWSVADKASFLGENIDFLDDQRMDSKPAILKGIVVLV